MNKKNILIGCALSLLSFSGASQMTSTYAHEWAFSRGSSGYEAGIGIVTGSDGSIYSVGTFEGTVNFDPFGSGGTAISHGLSDFYITKHDGDGHFIWIKSFGGDESDDVVAIDIDDQDNIYITGNFLGTVDFDPSPFHMENLTSGGLYNSNSYVCKFTSNGDLIWVKDINGDFLSESTDITVDNYYNVHISGHFIDHLDVDPSSTSLFIGTGGTTIRHGFCVTLNTSGNYLKHYFLEGNSTSNVKIHSVEVDNQLHQYFTGEFRGIIDFNPSVISTNNMTTGVTYQTFISSIDQTGTFRWARQLASVYGSKGIVVKTNQTGDVYILGRFKGQIDMNPGTSSHMISGVSSSWSLYVSKLNTFGFFVWGKAISGTGTLTVGNVYPKGMVLNNSGAAFITGYFNKSVDFDPNSGVNLITSGGGYDAFTCILNTSGSLALAKSIESTSTVINSGIAINNNEDIYTTGKLYSLTDFRPTGYPYYCVSLGGSDMFIHKIKKVTMPLIPINFKSANILESEFNTEVFPNPTSGTLNLSISGDEFSTVTVYSLSGKLIYTADHIRGLSTISLNHVNSGTYLVEIQQGEKIKRTKVIKN